MRDIYRLVSSSLTSRDLLIVYVDKFDNCSVQLLRSSLVNNKTQAVVCDDLGMSAYAVYANPKDLLKVKDRADLLEAFLGALYIDKVLRILRYEISGRVV